MKNMHRQKITIAPLMAFTAWLFLLAVPCFFFSRVFDYFLEESLQRKVAMAKPQMTNEMNRFVEELTPEFWLKQKFQQFDRQNLFKSLSAAEASQMLKLIEKQNADKLRRQLSEFLGVRVACLFFYGPDTTRVGMSCDAEMKKDVKPLPTLFLKRLLGFLSRQDKKQTLADDSCRQMIRGLIRKDGEKRLASNIEFLLQTIFKTITGVKINANEFQRTIAANLGNTGPIFYYFAPATTQSESGLHNLGGYLAVVRAQDISAGKIAGLALKQNDQSKFRRNLVKSGQKLSYPDHYRNGMLSAIEQSESRLLFRAFAPEAFLHHLVSSGTIRVSQTKQWRNPALMLEISADLSHFQHEMYAFKDEIRFLLLLIFILGSAILLRLSIYGINFRISVAAKISLAIFFAAMLPVALLFLTYTAFTEYNLESSKQTIRQYLELRQSILQKQVNSKLAAYQKQNLDLAVRLERIAGTLPQKEYILRWLENSLAASAFYENMDEPASFLEAPGLIEEQRLTKTAIDLTGAMANSYMQFLFQSPFMGKKINNLALSLTNGMSKSVTLHDFLRVAGTFVDISRISKELKFASIPIFAPNALNQTIPETLLILAFAKDRIMNQALTDLEKEMALSENWGEYQVDQAVFYRTENQTSRLTRFSSALINQEKVLPVVSLCRSLKRQVVWENDAGSDYQLVLARYEQQLPFIAVFQAKKLFSQNNQAFAGHLLLGISYLTSLLCLILLLSRQTFIDPISKIAQGLEEVASGNLQHRFSVASGDEFETLATELNRMTRGLTEREKLAMYVSEEVLAEVSRETGQVLNPGGELIEAAVLFCEPCDFETLTADLPPFKVVDHLNYFLATCARVSGEYHGTIDKLIDSTVMIVFRHSEENEQPTLNACKTALALNKILKQENNAFPYLIKTGISAGQVISGKIGAKTGKLDFTLIGDTVNMAARVKNFAAQAETSRIVLAAAAAEKVASRATLREIGLVQIKGKSGQHRIYELIRL